MATGSLTAGAIGVLTTLAAAVYLIRKNLSLNPHLYWGLGIASLFPGWLLGFIALLPSTLANPDRTPLPPIALLSIATGLLGAIVTDYLLRSAPKWNFNPRPLRAWLLGLAALFPSYLLVMVFLRSK